MRNIFTLKQLFLSCTVLLMSVFNTVWAQQQVNWAEFATFQNSSPMPSPGGYEPIYYNDLVTPEYPALADSMFSYVSTGGTIKVWWNFPNAFPRIDKIVFHKNQRPMTSCWILRFDHLTGITDTIARYFNTQRDLADSIFVRIPMTPLPIPVLPTMVRDTIYFVGVTGPQGSPDFREIQMFRFTTGPGVAGTDIIGRVDRGPRVAGPGLGNTINTCPGYNAILNALPQTDSARHYYQWQISSNNTVWSNIPGATDMGYEYKGVINAYFRVLDSFSGAPAAVPSSNTIQVAVNPTYITPPATGYVMNFNSPWLNSSCLPSQYSGDIPAAEWSNNRPMGFYTWRIDNVSNVPLPNKPAITSWNPSSWNAVSGAQTPQPNTSTPYGVNFGTTNRYARVRTSANTLTFDTTREANLDLYLNLGGSAGNKLLTFYYMNVGPTNFDTLRVLMSTDAGQTWTKLGTCDTSTGWRKSAYSVNSNSAQTIIRFNVTRHDQALSGTDIGLDSVFVAMPCSGTPTAGKLRAINLGGFAKVQSVCAGASLELTSLGSTMAGDLVYEWQHSYDLGNTFTAVNGGVGSNNLFFTTPPIYDTVLYRLALKCGASGTVVYSDTLRINISGIAPTYASIPYRQNFETWGNGCSTGDVVLSANNERNWANSPHVGVNSWRKNLPEPASAIWPLFPGQGWSTPVPTAAPPGGNFSARFHSHGTFTGVRGNLDLLFDGSSVAGNKELRFFYTNSTGHDSMEVFYSVDSGFNFNKLGGFRNAAQWTQYTLQVPCQSSKCVVRFQAIGFASNQTDIGLDSVTLAPPCVGLPTAGTLVTTDTLPCPGQTFTLNLQNFSNTGGLTFTWYQRPTTNPNWTLAQQDLTKTFFTTNTQVPRWYKVVVRCTNSGLADSAEILINVAQFYYCYCAATAANPQGVDIGNVNIKRLPAGTNLLNNGIATPANNNATATGTYKDYRYGNPKGWLPLNPAPLSTYPTPIYHDTSYHILVSQINSGNFAPATVTVWIDTNRNGLFDGNEIMLRGTTALNTTPPQRVDQIIALPDSTRIGFTGMRVMIEAGSNVNSAPCGTFSNGEVEDYLVEIRHHPCTGPASAGTVNVSDTSACMNYAITLTNTTHADKQYGLRWVWQYSPDSNSWADLPNSQNKDTMQHIITAQTWYRMRMVCLMTFDTTYSNTVKVSMNPVYACYCYSQAEGGSLDTSDIGGLAVTGSAGSGVFVPSVGPHLLNPWAVNPRTDYTKYDTLHLWLDSMYQILVFHTIRTATHADAKITLFMDLNNDGLYNITNNPFTNERIWTGYTTASYFTVVDSIKIPTYGIPGVLTGMRVILNDNTQSNGPSDSACGPYVSGETEDYVIMLHNPANPWPPFPSNINNLNNVTDLWVYPNPTEGKFTVRFEAAMAVQDATITVSTVTGQEIVRRQISKPGKKMMQEIDLTHLSKGVYMVELRADNERLIRKLIVK